MNLLLDAHTVIWLIYEPERLPGELRTLIADPGNALYISLATVWELANKVAAHRLPLAGTSVERMVERIRELGATFLAISPDDIVAAAMLPWHHLDPFDRMIVAQAQARSLLVTNDSKIAMYEVEVLWR